MTDAGAALTTWIQQLGDQYALPVIGLICASSLLEHLFPPYPGDVAVAFGLALAVAKGWSIAGAFGAAVFGSFLGSVVTFYAGRWLAGHKERATHGLLKRLHAAVEPAVGFLMRRGVLALVFSRFVPVGRAVIVVAAGYGKMEGRRALPAAVLGSVLWDAVLLAVAVAVGTQYARLARVLTLYSRAAYVALGVGLAAWALHAWMKRGRS